MANTTLRRISVNGKDYIFICNWRKNRSGFVHECELQQDSRTLAETKAQYYNRTWESYTYQSVMSSCVYQLKSERKAQIKANLMEANNWGRMTEARKVILESAIQSDSEIAELEALSKEVNDGYQKYNFW